MLFPVTSMTREAHPRSSPERVSEKWAAPGCPSPRSTSEKGVCNRKRRADGQPAVCGFGVMTTGHLALVAFSLAHPSARLSLNPLVIQGGVDLKRHVDGRL